MGVCVGLIYFTLRRFASVTNGAQEESAKNAPLHSHGQPRAGPHLLTSGYPQVSVRAESKGAQTLLSPPGSLVARASALLRGQATSKKSTTDRKTTLSVQSSPL